ncbi:MAG: hypothetical protein UX04_C0004G0015 [Microgenomates group bacterium GW2011_GWF2_45_18]|nr:MAG: hypothetical protein UW18_C0004G0015 [Microgenomates group bacterium GW2011_GWF1_44_10]KKU01671.1 MAG: hypothetical protein UX04_C0004G0015 [Microgenomates group bacterium GW2011_GWF2_45_18]OGJ40051.1 MAG: hypothetical protein A2378_01065 [Candidatus Pacebacteria bacterium RIFOXYB1_FULL_44_10]HAU99360.1 hypothetical protein [Candidatus Paceibacterota bacterium]HAX01640.1 hypothetical protein [Candidatus Paceibacterota bacterium]
MFSLGLRTVLCTYSLTIAKAVVNSTKDKLVLPDSDNSGYPKQEGQSPLDFSDFALPSEEQGLPNPFEGSALEELQKTDQQEDAAKAEAFFAEVQRKNKKYAKNVLIICSILVGCGLGFLGWAFLQKKLDNHLHPQVTAAELAQLVATLTNTPIPPSLPAPPESSKTPEPSTDTPVPVPSDTPKPPNTSTPTNAPTPDFWTQFQAHFNTPSLFPILANEDTLSKFVMAEGLWEETKQEMKHVLEEFSGDIHMIFEHPLLHIFLSPFVRADEVDLHTPEGLGLGLNKDEAGWLIDHIGASEFATSARGTIFGNIFLKDDGIFETRDMNDIWTGVTNQLLEKCSALDVRCAFTSPTEEDLLYFAEQIANTVSEAHVVEKVGNTDKEQVVLLKSCRINDNPETMLNQGQMSQFQIWEQDHYYNSQDDFSPSQEHETNGMSSGQLEIVIPESAVTAFLNRYAGKTVSFKELAEFIFKEGRFLATGLEKRENTGSYDENANENSVEATFPCGENEDQEVLPWWTPTLTQTLPWEEPTFTPTHIPTNEVEPPATPGATSTIPASTATSTQILTPTDAVATTTPVFP